MSPPAAANVGRPAGAASPKKAAPDPTLAADVAAFAARLGLATARPDPAGGGFDDGDFAPEKARQKLGGGGATAAGPPDAGRSAARRQPGPPASAARPGGRLGGRGAPLTPDRGAGRYGDQQHQQRQHQRPSFGLAPPPGPAPPSLLGKEGGSGAPWHEAAVEAAQAVGGGAADPPASPPSDALVAAARAAGGALLDTEAAAAAHARARARDADARWLSAAAAGGTASDRIAASALLIADRPAGGLAALDDLIKLSAKRAGARAPAAAALDALADLFAGPLLPPGRRLIPLGARNLGAVMGEGGAAAPPSKAKARVLLFWALEDALKRRASDFLDALAEASRDALPMLRSKAARALAGLLASRPEGEARALGALVNKLGDPARRLASDAAHLLDGVLAAHPAMAPTVADAVEKFALRPGQAERARYTAILFLSTLPLARTGAGAALAARLVDAYFGLFRAILSGGLGHASVAAAARDAKAATNGGGKKNKRAGKKGRHKARPAQPKKVSRKRGGMEFIFFWTRARPHFFFNPPLFLRCGAVLTNPSATEQPIGGESSIGRPILRCGAVFFCRKAIRLRLDNLWPPTKQTKNSPPTPHNTPVSPRWQPTPHPRLHPPPLWPAWTLACWAPS
jgi:ribosome biogenesis protein MAK21